MPCRRYDGLSQHQLSFLYIFFFLSIYSKCVMHRMVSLSADVPLKNYSLTHSLTHSANNNKGHKLETGTAALVECRFGGGWWSLVDSSAVAAAACWAFLMLAPDASYSSSPSFSLTENTFLWAGPCSSVKQYWCFTCNQESAGKSSTIGVCRTRQI